MAIESVEVSLETLINEDNSEPPGLGSFTIGSASRAFAAKHFPNATAAQWNDWQWQIRNSFTSIKGLSHIITLDDEEKWVQLNDSKVPLRITPYYASLFFDKDSNNPLRRSVVPVMDELLTNRGEKPDPLNELSHNTTRCIVHRYPDRVLFLGTGFCSTYCRYCTRTHMVSKAEKKHLKISDWHDAIDYITAHQEVRDVLLSGGDPLTMSDSRLKYLLTRLRAIPHVEIIRIGTKVPAVLPQRITPELVNLLKQFHPLYISLHITHPDEFTAEMKEACMRLADAGIPLGSQTVLLKGINDEPEVYKKLTHEMLKVRVRPYYLYQCDPIPGSAHFRTPISKGIEIIKSLRGFTSGYAVPQYVVDAPGGGGKIPMLPEYFKGHDEQHNAVLENFEGNLFKYPDYL
jgi:lysine 2,3-aminomutase